MPISYPHPGMSTWMTAGGYRVLRLSHEADPAKGTGEKVFVPEMNMHMSPWLLKQYTEMSDKDLFRQEILIDFEARQGQLLFTFKQNEAAILEKPFPIPHSWTRYYAVDPHPRVPHAHLWCAVDPYGDRWYYREFWPSKMYGKPGNVPEDDNRYTIKQHLDVVKYLESAENDGHNLIPGCAFSCDNKGKPERIYRRIIDYAARAFGQGTSDDYKPEQPQENFQVRFEKRLRELRMHPARFQDCIKGRDSGIAKVNEGFTPLKVERNGKMVDSARIHIFETCVETIHQLRTNRYPQLTAIQADRQDPIANPLDKRRHQTDLVMYLEMAEPRYHESGTVGDNWDPIDPGVAY